ncbi:unnamed protein product [Penicillium salamii]|uniref:Uncharacterized protein n=1 Tax=Penicillium salamii TaxID=1612424 RepID=A0A9W4NXE7_9EURO|nr:unnamed protein product [Penicillium salamii]CAG8043599.1 unnamed protein product [Penicillium salamii]CAG8106672.1 unnamed protein product [Penicillium salamii]CAG8139869.1 unnamed protein product [Penicillium salamii]CAG8177591.1 unnamed protein product [Penicillium salamii]
MSTQSPHPPTPKGSRNPRRPNKKSMTPQAQKPGLSTPPSSPPGNISAGLQTDSSNNFNSTKKKQAPRSVKKPRDSNSPATHNGYYNGHQHNGYSNGYRSTSHHTGVTSPQLKESAAYAGPTFHASPAPSSLPMPKFLPKAAPDADLVPPLETDSDSADLSPEPETTPSKHRSRPSVHAEPKPTALDFMFQAAKQAKENKATSSPDVSRPLRSPQTEPAARYHQDGMFASSSGNDYARHSPIGPSFAPSYQERMAALRPSSMPQSPELSDAERKAKTEQLKDLLLNPRPQKPPSQAPFSPVYGNVDVRQSPSFDRASPNYDYRQPPGVFETQSGSFDARPSNVHPYATPSRAASGPPLAHGNPFGNPPPQSNPYLRNPYPNPNSPLRGVVPAPQYQTHGAVSNGSSPGPYSNQYRQSSNPPAPWQGYVSPQPVHSATAFQLPTHSPSPLPSQAMDTQQIENDIRRVLKLDASSTVA